jgi:threonine/homoserine/homoserine lactone efflux protein
MPHLDAFLLVACLIVITPGPGMAMVTKNARFCHGDWSCWLVVPGGR